MVNTEELEKRIKNSGKKKGYLVDKLGISRPYFDAKIKGTRPFNCDEVKILCTELSINTLTDKEKIFFAKSVTNP